MDLLLRRSFFMSGSSLRRPSGRRHALLLLSHPSAFYTSTEEDFDGGTAAAPSAPMGEVSAKISISGGGDIVTVAFCVPFFPNLDNFLAIS
jgi:hypothetical protein